MLLPAGTFTLTARMLRVRNTLLEVVYRILETGTGSSMSLFTNCVGLQVNHNQVSLLCVSCCGVIIRSACTNLSYMAHCGG